MLRTAEPMIVVYRVVAWAMFATGAGCLVAPCNTQDVQEPADTKKHDNIERLMQLHSSINAMLRSPDGDAIVVACQDQVHVFDWPELNDIRSVQVDFDHVNCLRYSASGDRLWVGGGNPGDRGEILELTWPDLMAQRRVRVHDDFVWSFLFGSDGRTIVSAGHDSVIIQTDLLEQHSVECREHTSPVRALQFTGQSHLVSVSEDHSLRVWRKTEPLTKESVEELQQESSANTIDTFHSFPFEMMRTLEQHSDKVLGLIDISGLNRESWGNDFDLADACFTFSADRTVRYWKPVSGRMVRFVRLSATPLCGIPLVEPLHFAIGDDQGWVHVIDLKTSRVLNRQHIGKPPIESLLLAPDSRSILIGTQQGTILRMKH